MENSGVILEFLVFGYQPHSVKRQHVALGPVCTGITQQHSSLLE